MTTQQMSSSALAVPPPSGLSTEQQDFVAAIRDFARREAGTLATRVETYGGNQTRQRELYAKLAELGWLGVSLPEQYGGSGGSLLDACLFLEEAGQALSMIGFAVSLVVASAYLHSGSEEQKREIVSGVAAGTLEAIAISEPEAGSDVGNLSCRAEAVEGGFVINGQKTWISNAHRAGHILLVCRTDSSGSKTGGLSMIQLPANAAGLEIRGIPTMIGPEVNDLFFTDCFAAESQLVGKRGHGWSQLMAGFNYERVVVGAAALGLAIRAFEDCLAYVRERQVFGRPVASFQVQRHRIADMLCEIETTRAFIHDVARRVDANPGAMLPREASMVKLKGAELARRVTLDCQQMMGGYGIASEYGMEGHVRAALAGLIGGGTSDIHRETIAKTLGL